MIYIDNSNFEQIVQKMRELGVDTLQADGVSIVLTDKAPPMKKKAASK